MNRRHFLQLMAAMPIFTLSPALLAKSQGNRQKILLMVELKGGNDALNTLVPYEDPSYYRLRPKLGLKEAELIKLGNGFGMNKAMTALWSEWQSGDMAWIQGIGYPEPNRSHFRSIEIWETASQTDQYLDDGWIAQLYNKQTQERFVDNVQGIIIGSDAGPLSGDDFNSIQMQDKKSFIALTKQLNAVKSTTGSSALAHMLQVQNTVHTNAELITQKLQSAPSSTVRFPRNKFGRQLETTAQIILSGLNVPVYKVEIGSFDTHQNQLRRQSKLLNQLSEGLSAFSNSMKKAGLWDDILIVTYSEFGRRVNENASGGTDHGTAAAHFALGGRVNGGINKGLLGKAPSLTDLDNNDLKFTVDFKQYYNTLAQQWLGVKSPWEVYGQLPLVNV